MKKWQKPDRPLRPGDMIKSDGNGGLLVKKANALESAAVRIREWLRRLTY